MNEGAEDGKSDVKHTPYGSNTVKTPHYGNKETLNPCPRHPLNEIAYLDKTSKEGACETCLPILIQQSHELLPIQQTVSEVTLVLKTMQEQATELQQQKRYKHQEFTDLKRLIESDQQAF